jgi:hypothetical protein
VPYVYGVMSVSSLSTTSSALRGATGAGATDWLADTTARIKASENQGGLLGMLSTAAQGNNDGSTKSFLTNSIAASNMFATIAQSTVTSYSSLIAKQASARQAAAQQQKLADAMKSLQDTQSQVQAKNVLDPMIFMPDGSTIDTTSNIMTMANGDQYDITTGAKYVDPTMIIQMANGSYLDTKNNILTMANGTRIDAVTGIMLSTTA